MLHIELQSTTDRRPTGQHGSLGVSQARTGKQGAGGVSRTGGGGFMANHSLALSLGLKAFISHGMEASHG